jgi:hypothetical protein
MIVPVVESFLPQHVELWRKTIVDVMLRKMFYILNGGNFEIFQVKHLLVLNENIG